MLAPHEHFLSSSPQQPTRGFRMSLFAAKYATANQERQGRGVAGTYESGVGGWQASGRSGCLQSCGSSLYQEVVFPLPLQSTQEPSAGPAHFNFHPHPPPRVSPGQATCRSATCLTPGPLREILTPVSGSCSIEIGAPAFRESGDIGSQ